MKINKIIVMLLSLVTIPCMAEVAVVVHPSNNDALDGGDISKIFLGKAKTFPSGGQAVPINQSVNTGINTEFEEKVLNKSASQLKAYWSKLLFTGKGQPPKDVGAEADVLALVANNPNMIGYMDAAKVDGSVKVVARF